MVADTLASASHVLNFSKLILDSSSIHEEADYLPAVDVSAVELDTPIPDDAHSSEHVVTSVDGESPAYGVIFTSISTGVCV